MATTNFNPHNCRLNTPRLGGWLPFLSNIEENIDGLVTVKMNFEELVTIDTIKLQQGNPTSEAVKTSRFRIIFTDYSYNEQRTIYYSNQEIFGNGIIMVRLFSYFLN